MPKKATAQMRKERVEIVLQLLGLKHRENTIIGDALRKGISGGEKKRVTLGIEWTKSPAIWLFDEPTTGLDSSASFDVMRVVRVVVNTGATAAVALLQPSYEVFNLFDNVMLLTHGEIAFLGTKQEALDHFSSYVCNPSLNPAEFLRKLNVFS